VYEKKGLLVKDGNRLRYTTAEGEEIKEYRKNWTGELLDRVMLDFYQKAEDEVNNSAAEEEVAEPSEEQIND